MSRGPGILQDSILRALATGAAESMTAEMLRWSVYEHVNSRLAARTSLPTAWNTSFQRAASGLANQGRIKVTPRRLRTFTECVQHYPGKTLKSDLRSLRLTFLPVLLEWTAEAGGLYPKYDDAANELHHLRLLRRDRAKIACFKTKWAEIEERLRPIYGSATARSGDLLQL